MHLIHSKNSTSIAKVSQEKVQANVNTCGVGYKPVQGQRLIRTTVQLLLGQILPRDSKKKQAMQSTDSSRAGYQGPRRTEQVLPPHHRVKRVSPIEEALLLRYSHRSQAWPANPVRHSQRPVTLLQSPVLEHSAPVAWATFSADGKSAQALPTGQASASSISGVYSRSEDGTEISMRFLTVSSDTCSSVQ